MSTTTAPRVRPAGYSVVRAGRAAFLLHRRAAVVAVSLVVLLAAACLAYLCVGESFIAPAEVLKVITGLAVPGRTRRRHAARPRMVVGLLVGAAFGVAGALIQTVARNPLASPDIIGISQGASALTVGAMTFGVTSYAVLPYLSVLGGLLAALLVYAFAWRGGLHATRFVLIGIGFAIALRSVTTLFMTKGDYLVAQQAQIWMTGSSTAAAGRRPPRSAGPSSSSSRSSRGPPAPSAPSPWTTTRRPRSACVSAAYASASYSWASSSRPSRPAPRGPSTSSRSWPRRSPAV